MEPINRSNTGQGLGIAGLVLGIIAIPLAVSGCISILGLFLGIIGIVLSAIGLSQATKAQAQKGLILSGLVLSIIGTLIAVILMLFITTKARDFFDDFRSKIDHKSRMEMNKDADEAAGELGGGKGMEKALEELEEATASDSITDKDFNKLLTDYDDMVKKFVKLQEKGTNSSLAEVTQLSVKAAALGAKLSAAALRMTDEQRKKLEEYQKKYDEAFAKFNKK